MNQDTAGDERRIVTCDSCGTPYAAVDRGDRIDLVGSDGTACSACGGSSFSRITV